MSDGKSEARQGAQVPSVEGVRTLARLCRQAGVEELEATDGHLSIRLRLDLSQAVAVSPAQLTADADQANGAGEPHLLRSPWVGVWHRGPEPESEGALYPRPGHVVAEGDVLGVVEAMQLQHEVRADRSGTLLRFLIADGTPVEYGQPLAEIE